MGRKKHGIPGLSFSWKRATGITSAKRKFAKATGIPTTRSGRQRKAGAALGCLLPTILLIALLTLGFTFQARPAQWEYHVENFGTISEKKLNELAAQGWELVATAHNGEVNQFIFRRPK